MRRRYGAGRKNLALKQKKIDNGRLSVYNFIIQS